MLAIKKSGNKKWQKQPQLYRGRFFYLRQIVNAALAFFCMILVISLYLYFEKSDTLFVKRVEVLGQLSHLSQNDIITLSGIKPTDRLFSLDLGTVRKNVSRYPWVQSVKVRREFPDAIQIYVSERAPAALLSVDTSLYYVDENGKVFKKLADGESRDFPIISGFDKEFAERYPQLSKEYLKTVLDFYAMIREEKFYRTESVSEIHFDAVAGLTVFTAQSGLEIYYGRGDAKAKQAKLEKLSASGKLDVARYVRLDLDGKNKIVARELSANNEMRMDR